MTEILLVLLIVGIAIANLTHVLTEIDLFERPRKLLGKIPLIGKLFTCKFCQSNWLALAAGIYLGMGISGEFPMVLRIVVFWQVIHWISRLAHKVEDGLPVTAVANVNVNGQGSGS